MLNKKTSKDIIGEEINNPVKKFKLENTTIRFLFFDLSQKQTYESIYLFKANKEIIIKNIIQNIQKIDNIPFYDLYIFENDTKQFIDDNFYYYNEKFCLLLNNNNSDKIFGVLPIYLNKVNNIYVSLGNIINTLSFEILFYSPHNNLPSDIDIFNQEKKSFTLKIYDNYETKYRNRILFLNLNNIYNIKYNNKNLVDLNIFVPQDYKLIKSLNDNNNFINENYYKIMLPLLKEFLLKKKSDKYKKIIDNIIKNKSFVVNDSNQNSDKLIKLLKRFIPQGYDIIIRIDKKNEYHVNAHQIKYKKEKEDNFSDFQIKDIDSLIEKLKNLNKTIMTIYNNNSVKFNLNHFLEQVSIQRKVLKDLTKNYENYFTKPLNYSKREFDKKEFSLFYEYYIAYSLFLFDNILNVADEERNDYKEDCLNILASFQFIFLKIKENIFDYINNFKCFTIYEKILFLISGFLLMYEKLQDKKIVDIMTFDFKIFNFSDNNIENPYNFAKDFFLKIIKNLTEESRLFYIFLQINSNASNVLYSNETYNNDNNENISNYHISMLSLDQVKCHILKIFPKYIIRFYSNTKERANLNLKTNIIGINEKYLFKNELEKNENEFLKIDCKNNYSMPIIIEFFHEITGHSKYKESQKENENYPNYFQDDNLDFQVKSIDKIEMNEHNRKVESGLLVEYFISNKYINIKFLKDIKNNFSDYYNINLWIKNEFKELNSKIEEDIKTYQRKYKNILTKENFKKDEFIDNNQNISCLIDIKIYDENEEEEEEDD